MGYFKSYSLITEDTKSFSSLDIYIKIIKDIAISTIIGQAVKIFVENRVNDDFAIKLESYKSNKKFYEYLSKEISNIYKKNPEYRRMSYEEYLKTPMSKKMKAFYNKKDFKTIAKNTKDALAAGIIKFLTSAMFKFPGGKAMIIPIFYVLNTNHIGLGKSFMYVPIEIEGALTVLGLNFGKSGNLFINEVELFSFDENDDVVRIPIKRPPTKLYQLTKEEMKKVVAKMEKYKNKKTDNPEQLLIDYIKELRDDLC